MPSERVTKATENSTLVGAKCMHCQQEITLGAEVVVCPRCKAVHHVECWKERKGCARLGCSQIAETVVAEQDQTSEEKRLGDNFYLEKERPKQKWKIALGVVAAIIVVALLGYRGPDPAAGRDKITLMVQGGYLEIDFYNEVAKKFNEAHPDWYLETLVTPYSGYEQKLVVMFGARLGPSIFITPTDRYSMYAEQGAMLPLDDYLANQPELIKRFFPDGIEPLQVNGSVYGIPHPYSQEVFGIYSLVEKPDIAWTALIEILTEIEANYPEALRNREDAADTSSLVPNQ